MTGPLQVFASTNDLFRQRGLPLPYTVSVIAAQSAPVTTSAGLALVAEPLPTVDKPCDTLVIAGGWGVYGAAEDPALVEWVRDKAKTHPAHGLGLHRRLPVGGQWLARRLPRGHPLDTL